MDTNNLNFIDYEISYLNSDQKQITLPNNENSYFPYFENKFTNESNNNSINNNSSNDNINKFNDQKIVKETKPTPIMSSCEIRLIKDIKELKNNKNIGKHCEIIVSDYKKIKDTNNFQLIIEFKNYFSVKFVFLPDYPFLPPIMTYYSGNKTPYVFDSEGNIILENAKESKWTPILWLSTLVRSIELLIAKGLNNNSLNNDAMFLPSYVKYGKRKWLDYLRDEKDLFKDDAFVIKELSQTIKGVKS